MPKLKISLLFYALQALAFLSSAQQRTLKQPAAGVLDLTYGAQDKFTPYSFCTEQPMKAALAEMPAGKLPFSVDGIKIKITDRGAIIEIPPWPTMSRFTALACSKARLTSVDCAKNQS